MGSSLIPGARFISNNECEFVLWSPNVKSVQLVIVSQENRILIPEKIAGGYWKIKVPDCKPGLKYFYKINDELIPDPASVSQPEGIDGASALVDFSVMQWEDQEWKNIPLKKLIIYEIHIGTFSTEGNFAGVVSKLDYLSNLGITAIELMPVAQFSGNINWGYDGVYPFAVQNTYGGAFELMNLVNECHKRGIAVILDVVYNHHGPEGNHLHKYAPYMSKVHSTPWGKAFNFDGRRCKGVRNYFIQNVLMWFNTFHIDALRMDAVHAMHDNSEKHIIREISEVVDDFNIKSGVKHYLIGEVNLNDIKYTIPLNKGGFGLDAQWNDDFHHALHVKTTTEKNGYYVDFTDKNCFSKTLKDAFFLDGKYSKFRGKSFGKKSANAPTECFIVYSQNHDQVGNRRYGERKSTLVSFKMQKLIAACVVLSPFTPMLFMGEEYGEINPFRFFIDFKDVQLSQRISRGRENDYKMFGYRSFSQGYNPYDFSVFQESKLNMSLIDENEESAKLFSFYQKLIEIRKKHPVFSVPDRKKMEVSEYGNLFIIKRWHKNHIATIAINFGKKSVKYQFNPENRKYFKIIDSYEFNDGRINSEFVILKSGAQNIHLKGENIIVLSTYQSNI